MTSLVELTTSTDVFTTGRARGRYEVRICAIEPGRIELGAGFSVEAPHPLDDLAGANTVIIPGGPDRPHDLPPAVTHALRVAAARGARIRAIGSGRFVLAAAGLLGGRNATIRLDLADDLGHEFAHVSVHASGPIMADGISTCAGGASTVEMCVELMRQDHCPAMSDDPARVDGLAELLEWATARLDEPLTLADMARVARVSSRTLARRFMAAFSTTPMQWLLTQRVRRARHLLETTSEPVARIGRLTGFGSTSNFRLQFAKSTGSSPQAYRRSRRARPPDISRPAYQGTADPHQRTRDHAFSPVASQSDPTPDLPRSSGRSGHAAKSGHPPR